MPLVRDFPAVGGGGFLPFSPRSLIIGIETHCPQPMFLIPSRHSVSTRPSSFPSLLLLFPSLLLKRQGKLPACLLSFTLERVRGGEGGNGEDLRLASFDKPVRKFRTLVSFFFSLIFFKDSSGRIEMSPVFYSPLRKWSPRRDTSNPSGVSQRGANVTEGSGGSRAAEREHNRENRQNKNATSCCLCRVTRVSAGMRFAATRALLHWTPHLAQHKSVQRVRVLRRFKKNT